MSRLIDALPKRKNKFWIESGWGHRFTKDYYRGWIIAPLLLKAGFKNGRYHTLRRFATSTWIEKK